MWKRAVSTVLFSVVSVFAGLGWSDTPWQDTVCLASPYDSAATEDEHAIVKLVASLRTAIEPFPGMSSALEEGAPVICLAKLTGGVQGYFSVEDNRIVIGRGLSSGLERAIMLHELRHLHHSRVGSCPGPDLSMQESARITLALEADAAAVSLAVAWELRQTGVPEVWQALADWPPQSDIAEAFAAEMADSGVLEHATARAFAQWYASDWRRETYYVAACSDYLDRQDRTKALSRYGSAPSGFLEPICRLPDGRPYPCSEPTGTTLPAPDTTRPEP